MLVTIQLRIFRIPFCCPKAKILLYIKHKFACCFCRCKLLSHIKGETEIGDIKEEDSEQNI